VLGGPLYQLLRRAKLADDAAELLRRRVVFFSLLTWLPLLVLSAAEGTAWGGHLAVPFLRDVSVHARFLVAVPLLIMAELLVHRRIRGVVAQFLERDLIPEAALARFDAAIAEATRLRNSVAVEVALIAFVYVVGIAFIWRQFFALSSDSWYARGAAGGEGLSIAGLWLVLVSLPIFQFLLARWYFRLFVWARFLWHVARIEIRILPTHPDGVGGLAFLGGVAFAMAPLAAAHGALLAGVLAQDIFFAHAILTEYKVQVLAMVVFMLCLVVGPLLVFTPQLATAKRAANREYGALAQRYARAFDTKWMRGGAPADEPFIGSADIQSLTDLTNALNVVRGMQIVPFTRQALVQIAVATLLPIGPLLLAIMPLDDLLKILIGVVV
jgi:hypothetical protein